MVHTVFSYAAFLQHCLASKYQSSIITAMKLDTDLFVKNPGISKFTEDQVFDALYAYSWEEIEYLTEYFVRMLLNTLLRKQIAKEKEDLIFLMCHPLHKIDEVLCTYQEATLKLYMDTCYLYLMFPINQSAKRVALLIANFKECVLGISSPEQKLINKGQRKHLRRIWHDGTKRQ